MSDSKYNPQKTRGLYVPGDAKPYKLSRSKIDLFLRCPRCFWLDRILGISPPPPWPYSLNIAVDELLKKEFNMHRRMATEHPAISRAVRHGVMRPAVPFNHPDMSEWQDSLHHGIQVLHGLTNLLVFGGVDDIWQFIDTGKLAIVDYKATYHPKKIDISEPRYDSYKAQLEIYQWLLSHRLDSPSTSDIAFFLFCNADASRLDF
ncbi:MAG: hypothetical protein WC797_02335, partial [Candidatus Paceibacterota bacterium]